MRAKSRRPTPRSLLLLFGLALCLPACGGSADEAPADAAIAGVVPEEVPRLIYFGRPDCKECKAVEEKLAEVEKIHGDAVRFEVTDSTPEAVRDEMRRFGVDGPRGLVLLGQDGFPRWVSKGHDQDPAKIVDQIETTLATRPGEPEDYGK